MKIEKFKKDKSNTYKVYFEDDVTISLYDDVIVKYNLLVNKEMDKKKFDEIVKYNDFLDGYYKSIKYINKKLRTELEIEKYLKKIDISSYNIKKIIDLLYKDGYLNKELYVKAYINDQYNLTMNGPLKIKKDLISLGYEDRYLDNYLENYDWCLRIDKIIIKKVKINHKLSNNALKTKLLKDIIKMGYQKEDIVYYLEKFEFDNDEEYLKKELYKIKNKYSKKYEGNELEYKVINYLYKKGFNIEDIKRCYGEDVL